MNLATIWLCVFCQVLVVASQLFFKHAMAPADHSARSGAASGPAGIGPRMVGFLFVGILLQSLWFFLWLGILAKWELSRVYLFEGLNPVLVVLAACIFLRERIPWSAWIGIGLIAAGIAIVSQS